MNFLTATKGTRGRAISQVTIRSLFTTGTQIQFRDNSCVICDGLKWHWDRILSGIYVFPPIIRAGTTCLRSQYKRTRIPKIKGKVREDSLFRFGLMT
jgi:hypothetical protein